MTNASKLSIAGKTAIVAALMSGSSLAFAQDSAPTVPPAQQPPVVAPTTAQPAITPPPVVPTLPTESDRVNPIAAAEAATEVEARKQEASPSAAPARPRAVNRSAATPIADAVARTDAIAPDAVIDPSASPNSALVDEVEAIDAPGQDIAAIAPVGEPSVEQSDGISSEDVTLFGGLAAALAAIGLGAAFASRRRRRMVAQAPAETVGIAAVQSPPRPIRDDAVFQQFVTNPASAAPAPVMSSPDRVIERKPIMTRPDVPVTDPLFSEPVTAVPITDPLFAPRNDVEPPITDPLFAKHDRFAGRARTAVAREPEPVN
jgi:MYXO-CTERM domain-containing protein